ncbi:hypothetical protein [Caproiciproducens faecalis]|uniref:Initiator Replication protein n=1 Tax=Caproiciproducens faecalis TaxID=2820301 RepID=A0ABS7DMF5_9FIRM|nr:hypothetical protein [Caproiciproducens faecalis]MBW7572486.1 hypothetical protein [Caproiciproducens faecalis]
MEKEDLRSKGNHSIYVKYIELLLMNRLAREENFTCTITRKRLFQFLGLVNGEFSNKPYDLIKQQNNQIRTYDLDHFYQRAYQKLDKILFDALKNLKNRCLISYFEEIVIIQKDEDGKTYTTIANDTEIKCIDSVKKQVLDEMGLISLTQVFLKFKGDKFYSRVDSILKEQYNWEYTYKQFKLIYTQKNIIQEIPKTELQIEKLKLNQKVIDAMNQQAENNYKRNRDKYDRGYEKFISNWNGFGRPIESSFKCFKYNYDYVDIQKELANYLLKI